MTTDRTLPPPKTAPFFTCSEEGCNNKYQGYHGKVGCKCYSCDDKKPKSRRITLNAQTKDELSVQSQIDSLHVLISALENGKNRKGLTSLECSVILKNWDLARAKKLNQLKEKKLNN